MLPIQVFLVERHDAKRRSDINLATATYAARKQETIDLFYQEWL